MTQENKDTKADKADKAEENPTQDVTETSSDKKENNDESAPVEENGVENDLAAKLDALQNRLENTDEDDEDDPFDNFFSDEDDEYADYTDEEYDEKLDEVLADRSTALEQLSSTHTTNTDIAKSIFAIRQDIDQVKSSVDEYKQEQINALGQDLSVIIDTLTELRPSDEGTQNDPDLQSTIQGMDMISTSLSNTFNKHGVTEDAVENTVKEPSGMVEDHADIKPMDVHIHEEFDTIEDVQDSLNKIAQSLNKEVQKTQKLNKQLKDAQQSLERTEKKTSSKKDVVLEKFAKDLIGVADTLARAVEATPDETINSNPAVKKIMDGIEKTSEMLSNTFNKYGILKLESEGKIFDPNFHEAVTSFPAPDKENNTVAVVMENGYTLNGKLIRAARVGVVKNNP